MSVELSELLNKTLDLLFLKNEILNNFNKKDYQTLIFNKPEIIKINDLYLLTDTDYPTNNLSFNNPFTFNYFDWNHLDKSYNNKLEAIKDSITITFKTNDLENLNDSIHKIINNEISKQFFSKNKNKFTYEKKFFYIRNMIIKSKIENKNYNDDVEVRRIFFHIDTFKEKKYKIIAPIYGLRSTKLNDEFDFGFFKIISQKKVLESLKKNETLHSLYNYRNIKFWIKLNLQDYDVYNASEISFYHFQNFVEIMYFFVNDNTKNQNNFIKYYCSITNFFYKENSGPVANRILYDHIIQNDENDYYFITPNISYNYIDLDDNKFNTKSELYKIWFLYQENEEKNINNFKKQILKSSITLGKSFRSDDKENALIYCCIALESLFISSNKDLYTDSIVNKIAHCLAFIVCKDKQERSKIIELTKNIYNARSKLVHGDNLSDFKFNYLKLNLFTRQAICILLNDDKYKDVKKIEHLYSMVNDAQISY